MRSSRNGAARGAGRVGPDVSDRGRPRLYAIHPDPWTRGHRRADGRSLIQVNSDATGVVWPATVGALSHHACQVAGRDLTREEWARDVGDRPYERTCNSATR